MPPAILRPAQLATRSKPARFRFETTAGLTDVTGILGQDRAVEAVGFGVSMRRPGFHINATGPRALASTLSCVNT
jgi:hypothetical protein